MDTLSGIINAVIHRPYVFTFLAVYLALSITHLGLHRALLFTAIGYAVAFACEASSIRNGFPFGIYVYHPEAFEGELSILGVPFWDSLSFAFLTYFSYTIALFLYAPLYRTPDGDLQVLETKALRRAPRVLVTAALFMAMIDTVTDPVTLLGNRWFLGDLYHYPDGGVHFGVPWSNYFGWFFVGLTILMLYTLVDLLWLNSARGSERGCRYLPYRAILGGLVYLGVLGFMLVVSLLIGARDIATASILTYALPTAMAIARLITAPERTRLSDIAAHLDDFPESPIAKRYFADGPYTNHSKNEEE